MVIRKKDIKTRSRISRARNTVTSVEDKEVDLAPAEMHVIRKRGKGARFLGVSLVVAVLLLLGWFVTKLAIGGWQINKNTLLKDLFSLNTATLIGEDQGRVNIVLMGMPGPGDDVEGPDLTDTLIVASLSTTPEGKNVLFSLPRDLYVKVPGYGNTKINAVYEIGNNQEAGSGGKVVADIAGDILGLDIPYYVQVDFSGFEKLIDELGGVTITVDKDLYDDKYPTPSKGYETVDIKVGNYTMDGAMALKFARSRQSTSDFDRAARQQKVILAIRDKAKQMEWLSNPAKAITVMDILADHFATNMRINEMKRLISLIQDFDVSQLVNKVFDDSPTGLLYGTRVNEIYVLLPVGDDYKTITDYVSKLLSGEVNQGELDQQTAQEPLKIEVLNGTTITGLAKKVATKLEQQGYKVVEVGNNATKGFVKTMVYDISDGQRVWEVRKLAESLGAEMATDKITTSSGALARVVLGNDANQ
ncbi:MAG: LCP family protein [Patescibacteria group bacterium]